MRKSCLDSILLRITIFTGAIVTAVLMGFGFYLVIRQLTYVSMRNGWFGFSQPIFLQEIQPTGIFMPNSTTDIIPSVSPMAFSTPQATAALAQWDGIGRVTILVLGLDYRDWGARTAYSRSDTMILLTLDPFTKQAGILSVPRDLWIPIPGFKHGKINTAYYLGDAHKLPGGGPALAVKTVEQFLGVPINYYAQIDFNAFIRFIDEIGGVKVDVPGPITIDLLGSGAATKKKLQPGVQVLPGTWALAYARARYTPGGDFDRAQRQQQVILAIRDRILSFDLLPILAQKAPSLFQELSAGVRTNLSLEDAIKLAFLAVQIPAENIRQGVINQKYVLFANSPDELSILLPVPDKIHILRDDIFGVSGALSPLALGSDLDKMRAENAGISIKNGSSTNDLADRTAQYLRQQGANIVEVIPGWQQEVNSVLIDHTGKPYTLKYLSDLLHISPYKILSRYDANSPVDVEVILGSDWARNISLP